MVIMIIPQCSTLDLMDSQHGVTAVFGREMVAIRPNEIESEPTLKMMGGDESVIASENTPHHLSLSAASTIRLERDPWSLSVQRSSV